MASTEVFKSFWIGRQVRKTLCVSSMLNVLLLLDLANTVDNAVNIYIATGIRIICN